MRVSVDFAEIALHYTTCVTQGILKMGGTLRQTGFTIYAEEGEFDFMLTSAGLLKLMTVAAEY